MKKRILTTMLALVMAMSIITTMVCCDNSSSSSNNNSDPSSSSNNSSGDKEQLTWIDSEKTLITAFNDIFDNCTISVKEITQATVSFKTNAEYGYNESIQVSNVTYSNDLMYKLVLENDALYFDAGNKKHDENYYSFAAELAKDGDNLVYYEYTKTDSGWTADKGDQYKTNSKGTTYLVSKTGSIEAMRKSILRPMFKLIPWEALKGSITGNSTIVEDWHSNIASWYDVSSNSYNVVSDILSEPHYYEYVSSVSYAELDIGGDMDADAVLPYFTQDTGNRGQYVLTPYYNFCVSSMNFSIENERFTSLSFDVFFHDSVDFEDATAEDWRESCPGVHIEISDVGNSIVNVDSDIQPSRTNYQGVEVSDEILKAAPTFYTSGNYTVSYVSDFRKSSFGIDEPEFTATLKVSPTTISYYSKYYDIVTNDTMLEYFIQTIEDETHIATYTYDESTDAWYKLVTGVADNSTAEAEIAAYAEYYWCVWDETPSWGNGMSVTVAGNNGTILRYSDTLKAYIRDNEYNRDDMDESNTFHWDTCDTIYSFSETGLAYYMQRAYVTYYPDKDNNASLYAEGQMTKTISDIGNTNISLPTDFIEE